MKENKLSSLGKELSLLYDQICWVSERMRHCNSEFIQDLHQQFEEDENYKDFKAAVLATCLTQILENKSLKKYLKEVDETIEKLHRIVKEAISEYEDKENIWEALLKNVGEKKYEEILTDFYDEHFLTAQRFVLGSWLAKKRGDPLYFYKGPE